MTKITVLLLVAYLSCTFAAKDWWETATFYQIYPRSFKDSDGDGIGDLNGVRQKLPYFKEIGVTAFWLSPIFTSPMKDFGYDISDFYDIQPEYGTLADFDLLVGEAKNQGIKVILDFVPNHSSDKSEWFERSERREAGYEDFFIWHSGKPNPNNVSAPLPPNNWLSVFRFGAWKWSPIRQQFYYHLFLAEQPDLNYRNPAVVVEMKKVLKFWLDRGVDGFRVDSIACMFEIPADEEGNYPDEPLSGNSLDPESHAYLNHIYTIDRPENYDMVYQWRELLDEYKLQHGGDTRVMMTESYGSTESVMLFYGDGQRKGAQMPFNFQLLTGVNNDSTAADYKRIVDEWLTKMPADSSPNWVVSKKGLIRLF
jgi:alpha-glucosidase